MMEQSSGSNHNRIERILYLTGFLDNCAVSMANPIIIQALRCQGIDLFVIGIIGSISGSLQIFTGPVIGKLGDVNGWKRFLILSYIFPAIGNLILGTTPLLILIVITRVLNGIFKQGQLCRRAYLTELTPPTEHSTVLGLLNACNNTGLSMGPLIGGQLAELDPTLRLPFLVSSILFVLQTILTFLFIPFSSPTGLDEKNNSTNTLNWRTLFSKVKVFSGSDLYNQADILLFRFFSGLSILTFRRNLPILLEEIHHVEAYNIIGAIISFYSIVGVIASSLSGRISKLYTNQKTLVIQMSVLMCVTLFTVAWSPWLPLTVACMVPLGLTNAILRIAAVKLMLSRGDSHKTGVINAMEMSITSMSMAISPSVVGVAQEMSSQISEVMSGVLSVISVGLTLVLLQS